MKERAELLAERYAAGDLSESEAAELLQRLKADEGLLQDLSEQITLLNNLRMNLVDGADGGLRKGIMQAIRSRGQASGVAKRVRSKIRRRQQSRRRRRSALGVVVGVALCLLAVLLLRQAFVNEQGPSNVISKGNEQGKESGKETSPTTTTVRIVAAQGLQLDKRSVTVGSTWKSGTLTGTADSQGKLVWSQPELIVTWNGEMTLPIQAHQGSYNWQLHSGSITIDYPPEGQRPKLMLATPHARVSVTGTRFQVSTDATGTSVRTERGTVVVEDKVSGQQWTVQAGEQQDVAAPETVAPPPPVLTGRWQARPIVGLGADKRSYAVSDLEITSAGSILAVVNNASIHRSAADAQNFQVVLDFSTRQIVRSGERWFAAANRRHCLSADDGQRWLPLPLADPGGPSYLARVAGNPANAQELVVVTPSSGFHYSSDGGRQFSASDTSDFNSGGTPFHTSLSSAAAGVYYAYDHGNDRFLASEDGGRRWQVRSTGLQGQKLNSKMLQLVAMPGEAQQVLASVMQPSQSIGLYRSVDGARRWQRDEQFKNIGGIATLTTAAGPVIYAIGMTTDQPVWAVWRKIADQEWQRLIDTPAGQLMRTIAVDNNGVIALADEGASVQVWVLAAD